MRFAGRGTFDFGGLQPGKLARGIGAVRVTEMIEWPRRERGKRLSIVGDVTLKGCFIVVPTAVPMSVQLDVHACRGECTYLAFVRHVEHFSRFEVMPVESEVLDNCPGQSGPLGGLQRLAVTDQSRHALVERLLILQIPWTGNGLGQIRKPER